MLHNEVSYSHRWPLKIWFYCAHPAATGGETPIADGRRVYTGIDPAIREKFERKKVMYVRNYGEGLDLTWQEVFQTDSRQAVEQYCRQVNIHFEWKDNNRLKTYQVRQAVARHPRSGEVVWFNSAHMFHLSALQKIVRESLSALFAPDDLPRNAFYGDGSPIEDDELEHIRGVYRQEMIIFPWQKDDILLLDNMLSAHGRSSFTGPRKVMVAMAEPYSL